MPDSFRLHIRNALDNPALQEALDFNAERRLAAREKAIRSLPEDWVEMRQHAHDLRAEVVAHLDQYLEQFIEQVRRNGIVVHRATSATQALQIISEIAHQARATLVAKSKTMLSEEISLNQALQEQGFQVVETDLGEYIVQLRQERPAHLLTPAVHLRRQEVGETFHEKLGVPYTEDIPSLVRIARDTLRKVFLEAELGISGVNFGVVESGTLCIVTNEGNGRMVTTLPPVHIALMGIERLVPTMDNLALMLSVLPRSATGQKMTVYTNLIHSPAQEPGSNPQQRHLVLLNNGRQAIRQSPLGEVLFCIRCGACLNACPVFREIGGHAYVNAQGESSPYSGPIGSVLSPALFGQTEFGNLARASSLCGACKEVCPVDIDLPKLLLRVRTGKVALTSKQVGKPNSPGVLTLGLRVYGWLASAPSRFTLALRAAGLLTRLIAPSTPWIKLPAVTGWGYGKDFPRPAQQPFRDRIPSRLTSSTIVDEALPASSLDNSARAKSNKPVPLSPVDLTLENMVEQFGNELNAVGGNFTRVELSNLPEKIFEFLHLRSISSILAWDDKYLPAGLTKFLSESGIHIQYTPDPGIRAGLTGSLAAIAETGTLALTDGTGHPLITSLLPEIHIACLRQEDIYPKLKHVLGLPQIKEAPAAVLISGPSRTADIEMSLTIGVHGPGELQVFCW